MTLYNSKMVCKFSLMMSKWSAAISCTPEPVSFELKPVMHGNCSNNADYLFLSVHTCCTFDDVTLSQFISFDLSQIKVAERERYVLDMRAPSSASEMQTAQCLEGTVLQTVYALCHVMVAVQIHVETMAGHVNQECVKSFATHLRNVCRHRSVLLLTLHSEIF